MLDVSSSFSLSSSSTLPISLSLEKSCEDTSCVESIKSICNSFPIYFYSSTSFSSSLSFYSNVSPELSSFFSCYSMQEDKTRIKMQKDIYMHSMKTSACLFSSLVSFSSSSFSHFSFYSVVPSPIPVSSHCVLDCSELSSCVDEEVDYEISYQALDRKEKASRKEKNLEENKMKQNLLLSQEEQLMKANDSLFSSVLSSFSSSLVSQCLFVHTENINDVNEEVFFDEESKVEITEENVLMDEEEEKEEKALFTNELLVSNDTYNFYKDKKRLINPPNNTKRDVLLREIKEGTANIITRTITTTNNSNNNDSNKINSNNNNSNNNDSSNINSNNNRININSNNNRNNINRININNNNINSNNNDSNNNDSNNNDSNNNDSSNNDCSNNDCSINDSNNNDSNKENNVSIINNYLNNYFNKQEESTPSSPSPSLFSSFPCLYISCLNKADAPDNRRKRKDIAVREKLDIVNDKGKKIVDKLGNSSEFLEIEERKEQIEKAVIYEEVNNSSFLFPIRDKSSEKEKHESVMNDTIFSNAECNESLQIFDENGNISSNSNCYNSEKKDMGENVKEKKIEKEKCNLCIKEVSNGNHNIAFEMNNEEMKNAYDNYICKENRTTAKNKYYELFFCDLNGNENVKRGLYKEESKKIILNRTLRKTLKQRSVESIRGKELEEVQAVEKENICLNNISILNDNSNKQKKKENNAVYDTKKITLNSSLFLFLASSGNDDVTSIIPPSAHKKEEDKKKKKNFVGLSVETQSRKKSNSAVKEAFNNILGNEYFTDYANINCNDNIEDSATIIHDYLSIKNENAINKDYDNILIVDDNNNNSNMKYVSNNSYYIEEDIHMESDDVYISSGEAFYDQLSCNNNNNNSNNNNDNAEKCSNYYIYTNDNAECNNSNRDDQTMKYECKLAAGIAGGQGMWSVENNYFDGNSRSIDYERNATNTVDQICDKHTSLDDELCENETFCFSGDLTTSSAENHTNANSASFLSNSFFSHDSLSFISSPASHPPCSFFSFSTTAPPLPPFLSSNLSSAPYLSVSYYNPEETVIIFDWDDTLLPSTWLSQNKLTLDNECVISNYYKSMLDEMSIETIKTLQIAKHYAHVIIITNAEHGWVELSCNKFMPILTPLLKLFSVVSARSTYESSTFNTPISWKQEAFRDEIQKYYRSVSVRKRENSGLDGGGIFSYGGSNIKNVEAERLLEGRRNILSFGDSAHERLALLNVCNEMQKNHYVKTKSIKFIERPDIEDLRKEHKLLVTCLTQLIQHDGDLDLCIKSVDLMDDRNYTYYAENDAWSTAEKAMLNDDIKNWIRKGIDVYNRETEIKKK